MTSEQERVKALKELDNLYMEYTRTKSEKVWKVYETARNEYRKIEPSVKPRMVMDNSTRQRIDLHDHETVTVEKISIAGTPWFIIIHSGVLPENEFRTQLLVTEEEGLKIAKALQTAEINPEPEGA